MKVPPLHVGTPAWQKFTTLTFSLPPQPLTQRLYKAAGEDARHQYTMTLDLPEFIRAKTNAANLSDVSLSPLLTLGHAPSSYMSVSMMGSQSDPAGIHWNFKKCIL